MAKRARERLVRSVATVKRDGKDVRGADREAVRGLAQPSGTDVVRQRPADGDAERTRQVKSRYAHRLSDHLERQVIAEVALDVPDGPGRHAHANSIAECPAIDLIVFAVRPKRSLTGVPDERRRGEVPPTTDVVRSDYTVRDYSGFENRARSLQMFGGAFERPSSP